MAQQNPWEVNWNAPTQQQPSQPPRSAPPATIPGAVSPTKQAAEARAQQDQALQMERFRLDQEKAAREAEKDQRTAQKDAMGTVEQGKSASFLKRAVNANTNYSGLGDIGARSYVGQKVADIAPDVTNYFSDANRQKAEQAEREFIAAVLRYDSGAAIPPQEFVTNGKIYFPRPGDTPEVIAQKAQARRVAIDGLKASAGPAGSDVAIPDFEALYKQAVGSADGGNGGPSGNTPPPLLPPAGTGGGQPMAPVQGNMRAVDNPELANKAFAMWRSGKSLDEISAYVQSQGYGPIIPNQETLDYARKHPGWNPFSATKYEPVSTFEKAITTTFGNDPYGVAGYGIGAGQFLSGNTLDNLAADPERARLAMDVAAQQSPTGTALGTVSGGVLGSILGEVALARAGMAPGMARSLLADIGYGAANGAGMADAQGQGRTANALLGAVYAGGGNIAGRTVGRGVNAFGRGVQNSATRSTINNVGDLTVGQVYGQSGRVGGALRGVEDRLSGLPIVGDSINAARARSFESFNAKAFDKALEPIGQKLSGEVGADALNAANMKVQQAFKDALDGKSVVADQPFVNEITQATMKAMSIGRVGPELSENIADILGPHMQQGKNGITGEEMQIISQELRALKAAYKKSEPAMYKRISAAIDSTENAIFGMFRRQAPDVVPKYNAAKQAYRRVSILADAQLAAKNQPDNMVTPAQLNAADAANAKKYEGSIKAASGQRQFRDLAEPAQAVLPNKVPDSGTAGRLLVAGAGVGGVVGGGSAVASGDPTQVGSGAGTGLMLSAILMGAYTKAGQRILTKPGRGTPALTDPRIQRILSKLGAATGAVSLPESSPAP